MTRLLYNRQTLTLQAYNRPDDSPVVGLDRDLYHVVERIDEPPPEYDPAAFSLAQADPVVIITDPDGEDINGTATYGWRLDPIVPPAPPPDWARLREEIRNQEGLKSAFRLALQTDAIPAIAIVTRLDDAERNGNFAPFLESLRDTLAALPRDNAEFAVRELARIGAECHMPQALVIALEAMLHDGQTSPGQ